MSSGPPRTVDTSSTGSTGHPSTTRPKVSGVANATAGSPPSSMTGGQASGANNSTAPPPSSWVPGATPSPNHYPGNSTSSRNTMPIPPPSQALPSSFASTTAGSASTTPSSTGAANLKPPAKKKTTSATTTTTGSAGGVGGSGHASATTSSSSLLAKPKATKASGAAGTTAKRKRPSALPSTKKKGTTPMVSTTTTTTTPATTLSATNTHPSGKAKMPTQKGGSGGGGSGGTSMLSSGGTTIGPMRAMTGTSNVNASTTSNTTMINSATIAAQQQILADARAAQFEIVQQRAAAAARRADPMWYRVEDVLPVLYHNNHHNSHQNKMAHHMPSTILPEEAQIVEQALYRNGLTRADVTPQAMACLLEQARRYAQELLIDAEDYAQLTDSGEGRREQITRADLILAAELRADSPMAMSAQVPKLNLLAQQVNRRPLPPIPGHCFSGVVLPSREHQLTARTYDIVSAAQIARRMVRDAPEAPVVTTNDNHHKNPLGGGEGASTSKPKLPNTGTIATSPAKTNHSAAASSTAHAIATPHLPSSYGASRGRQIPINLKEPNSPPSVNKN